MGATQVSIKRQMDEDVYVCVCVYACEREREREMEYLAAKEWNSAICSNMNGPREYDA